MSKARSSVQFSSAAGFQALYLRLGGYCTICDYGALVFSGNPLE